MKMEKQQEPVTAQLIAMTTMMLIESEPGKM